jgi:hypothetical protein
LQTFRKTVVSSPSGISSRITAWPRKWR